jgi:hypothetical protein
MKKTFEEKKEIVESFYKAKEKYPELVTADWLRAKGINKTTFYDYIKTIEKENEND